MSPFFQGWLTWIFSTLKLSTVDVSYVDPKKVSACEHIHIISAAIQKYFLTYLTSIKPLALQHSLYLHTVHELPLSSSGQIRHVNS